MVYSNFGDGYMIRQTAKLKWPPNILGVQYNVATVLQLLVQS